MRVFERFNAGFKHRPAPVHRRQWLHSARFHNSDAHGNAHSDADIYADEHACDNIHPHRDKNRDKDKHQDRYAGHNIYQHCECDSYLYENMDAYGHRYRYPDQYDCDNVHTYGDPVGNTHRYSGYYFYKDRDPQRHIHGDRHEHACNNVYTDGHANNNADEHPACQRDIYTHSAAHFDSNKDVERDAVRNPFTDIYKDTDTFVHEDSNDDRHGNSNANCNAHSYRNVYADVYPYFYTDTVVYPDGHSVTNADMDKDGHANDNRHADSHPDGHHISHAFCVADDNRNHDRHAAHKHGNTHNNGHLYNITVFYNNKDINAYYN